jgi:hypothetical protein
MATAMQQTGGIEARKSLLIVLSQISSYSSELDELADEILWRMRGHNGPAESANPSPPLQSVENRFLDTADSSSSKLLSVVNRLKQAIEIFDQSFGL